MREECKSGLHNVSVSPLRESIMLWSMWRSCEVRDAVRGKKISQGDIFSSVIGIKCDEGLLKPCFYKGFPADEDIFDIRFASNKVEPDVMSEVINKYHMLFESVNRVERRGPYI